MNKALSPALSATLALAVFLSPQALFAQGSATVTEPTRPEIHINGDGKASVSGLKVIQMAGSTIFGRTTWDESFIRWVIKTGKDTAIKKRFGDPQTVADIKVGDLLTVDGVIEGGSTLTLIARNITNWSNYEALGKYSGTVLSVSADEKSFQLQSDAYGDIKVFIGSQTNIIRHKREITAHFLRAGDRITSIEGVFDVKLKTLVANTIFVYISPSIFTPQNYQGTLKTAPDPTTKQFVLTVNGKNYEIIPTADVLILNSKRTPVTFERFLVGDTVRVYGFIRQDDDDLDSLSVSVIRNITF